MLIRKNVGKDGWAFAMCAGLGGCLIIAAACAGGDTPPRDGDLEEKIRSTYDPDYEIGGAGSSSLPAGGSGGGGGSGSGQGGSGSAAAGAGGGSSATGGSTSGGSSGAAGSGSSGSGTVPAACGDVVERVLVYNCGGVLGSGCHGAGARLGNFGEDEAAARALVDKPTLNTQCGKYIDSANPEASAILTKLADPPCGGSQMPFNADPLSQDDIDCVKAWVNSL